MSTNKERPDRQTARLKWFDYSTAGFYVATICTYNLQHAFGEIDQGTMHLNESGRIAQSQWIKVPERFPGIALDHYIIMPNHIHGIVVIYRKTNIANVPERFRMHMQALAAERHPAFKDTYQPPTLGAIIRAYKAATARLIRVSGVIDFAWHGRYHEKVLRDDVALDTMRNYIQNNPANWQKDKLYIPRKT